MPLSSPSRCRCLTPWRAEARFRTSRYAIPDEKDLEFVPVPLTQTTGRRKRAVARVRFVPGSGNISVNGRPFDEYFTSSVHRMEITEPLRLTEAAASYDVSATVDGGGVAGQAGALRLGIARSLLVLDPEVRPTLKSAGLLHRDDRKKESKKYGLKKARQALQYSMR